MDIAKWEPDINDLAFGRALMIVEDYSKTVQVYSRDNIHFCALVYSILSLREKFDMNREQFYEMLRNDLNTAEKVLRNEGLVQKILSHHGLGEKKVKSILSAAHAWDGLDITARMREDTEYEKGSEFREEIVKTVYGVGYKFASLFIRMSGYENIVPVDTWAIKYVESRGFHDRYAHSGLSKRQYLAYEKQLIRHAKRLGVSPALLQATIYTTWSTWKKDSKIVPG